MPVISRFYGILIKMYFNDHLPPHIHAIYNEYNALYNIKTGELMEGDLPNRARKLTGEWLERNREALLKMWESQKIRPLPGLE